MFWSFEGVSFLDNYVFLKYILHDIYLVLVGISPNQIKKKCKNKSDFLEKKMLKFDNSFIKINQIESISLTCFEKL